MRLIVVSATLAALVLSKAAYATNVMTVEATCGSGPGIAVAVTGQIDPPAYPDLVGFDVYRDEFGLSRPGEHVRLTSAPIPFAGGAVSFSLSDPDAAPNVIYFYHVFGVDANRNSINLANLGMPVDVTSCGDAPLAIIHAVQVNGRWTAGPACGDCCELPGAPGITYSLPSELQYLIDGGYPLPILVLGTIVDMPGSLHGPTVIINSWSLNADCGLVGVEPASWTQVKRIYR